MKEFTQALFFCAMAGVLWLGAAVVSRNFFNGVGQSITALLGGG